MNDSEIIDLFFERSENAIVELSAKYGPVCMKVAMNLLGNNVQDAEECVNDAYLGVWNAVPPERPQSLLAFVCRIVRNVSINRYKHNRRNKRGNGNFEMCIEDLDGNIASRGSVEEQIAESELSSYIDEFLDSLDKEDRIIFVRRFWYMDSYKNISKASGLKEVTVRVRLSRTKSKLKDFLQKRGVIA